jgi:hypothetical protein
MESRVKPSIFVKLFVVGVLPALALGWSVPAAAGLASRVLSSPLFDGASLPLGLAAAGSLVMSVLVLGMLVELADLLRAAPLRQGTHARPLADR